MQKRAFLSKVTCNKCDKRIDVLSYKKKYELNLFFKIRHIIRVLKVERQHEKICEYNKGSKYYIIKRIKWFFKMFLSF